MFLISVIIPVYNVEKYLKRCVDSVLNQTYKNIEVILVDDGSPDGCPAICDEYAVRDSRVTVLHKYNGGLSSARNEALNSHPKGDFVTFVDSDDWIELDTYEYCVHLLNQNIGTDVVQFDSTAINDHYQKKRNPKEILRIYKGKDILQHYLFSTTKSSGYSVCRCLFSSHLIGNLRFREGKINEDIDWKYQVLERSHKMIDSNQIKYFYYQSGESTSGGPLKFRDFQLREAAELLCNLTQKESYGDIAFLGRVKKARTAFSLLSKIAYYGIDDSSIDKNKTIKELTIEHRGNLLILLKSPIPLSRKILAVLFAVNYKIAETLVHFVKSL
jgi:glycosyltransferase involved in cell wall biosynthesis